MVTVRTLSSLLQSLQRCRQSIWLDYIRRSLITSGELKDMIDAGEILGVTSNPAIFQKAIAGSTDYDFALDNQVHDLDAISLYEKWAIEDIQATADLLLPVYQQTHKRDGYVSLEVSPYLSNDTEQTIPEARRLWQAVNRPNLMVKVPATAGGIPAIKTLISEGINVNVTLLFFQKTYEQVAEAYISGLEIFAVYGGDVSNVASVASFFISRIDTAIDSLITANLKNNTSEQQCQQLKKCLGRVAIAIANAKLTYECYQSIYQSERWQQLAQRGAQSQRLLWASTGTKNPQYSDVLYVEELIGADTVNTVPPVTLDAFRDHGQANSKLAVDVENARITMQTLAELGISMQQVTDNLLKEGVDLFVEAFDSLLSSVEKKREAKLGHALNKLSYSLPNDLNNQVQASLQDWQITGKIRRLWGIDASLWTGTDESNWLGWLNITDDQLAHIDHLKQLAEELRGSEFNHILLLGMGGSSLCPEVMKLTFGKIDNYPELLVLDSTDPAQIQAIESKIDIAKTLFIVSSKSGGTLEPNIFKQYFFDKVAHSLGAKEAGNRFIAITDAGSQMQRVAENDNFRHIFFGSRSIGGRYSALSDFGMVPAAAMGVNVASFLDNAEVMVYSCASSVPASLNPGVVLGTILGVCALNGRDKVTLITSPRIVGLGAWLEQLLAESTGKDGKGIIPIDREPLGIPSLYGEDRLFAYIRLDEAPDLNQDVAVTALEQAGHPVIRISIADTYQLGQEFFRWEMATAVAGSIIGINAFNQPDVEASKIVTHELTKEYEQTGTLRTENPITIEAGLELFTDEKNAVQLSQMLGRDRSLGGYLRAHLNRLKASDYFALLAYVEMNEENFSQLQTIRQSIRDSKKVATCLGFGPRFLHSTGQAYKGGPNSGVILQITCTDKINLPVPQQKYSFGVVKAAQARGDFQVLAERGRRVLRVDLGENVSSGLEILKRIILQSLFVK